MKKRHILIRNNFILLLEDKKFGRYDLCKVKLAKI